MAGIGGPFAPRRALAGEPVRRAAAVVPGTRAVDLTLGASLSFGERLAVDGDVAVEREPGQGSAGEARLRVAWRF